MAGTQTSSSDAGQAGTQPSVARFPKFPRKARFFFFNVKTRSVTMLSAIPVTEGESHQLKPVCSPHRARRSAAGDLCWKDSRRQSWESLGRSYVFLRCGKAGPGTWALDNTDASQGWVCRSWEALPRCPPLPNPEPHAGGIPAPGLPFLLACRDTATARGHSGSELPGSLCFTTHCQERNVSI